MPNLNRVFLMGHLTRDPELRYTPSGSAVCDFTLALNRKWKNAEGQAQEEVSFIDCTAWAKTAETIAQYTKKGRPLFVEGYLVQDRWEAEDGQKRSKIKVTVNAFQFLGQKQDEAAATEEAPI